MHKSLIALAIVPAALLPAFGASTLHIKAIAGEVGVGVLNMQTHHSYFKAGDSNFPMQSVFKFPISVGVLKLADDHKLSLDDKVIIRRTDIVGLHSPLKSAMVGDETPFTIRDLIVRTIKDSDNTAADMLQKTAGGGAAITKLIAQPGVRVDRPEAQLQPDSLKINSYLQDPRDTATPRGMVSLLERLYTGTLLSPASTKFLLDTMFACKTGQDRLTAGLPAGWRLAHKTGTGQDVGGRNTATNDVGIMVAPDGHAVCVAVFVKGSSASVEQREKLIAEVAAQVAAEKY